MRSSFTAVTGAGANQPITPRCTGKPTCPSMLRECVLFIPGLNSQLDLGFVGYDQRTMGRGEWGQTGVTTNDSTDGIRMGPPAARR